MRKLKLAGIHLNEIRIDNDYIAGSDLDISTMSLNQETGFEFELPVSELPNLYNSDSFAVKITDNVKRTNLTITVEDSSLFVIGNQYWIKNERIQVTSTVDATTISVLRGRKSSFANNYYMQFGDYYITTEPQTFVGLRAFLYENDDLIAIGIIAENPTVENKIARFNCDGLEKSLEQPLPVLDSTEWFWGRNKNYMEAILFFWMLGGEDMIISELPPITDLIDLHSGKFFDWSEDEIYFKNDKFNTLKEFVDLYSQVNLSVFAFDQKRGKYRFIPISAPLTLKPIPTVKLGKYRDITQVVSTKLYNGISDLTIKLNNTNYRFRSTQINSFNTREKLELDLNNTNAKEEDIMQIGLKYINQFSLVYSMLEIPSSSYKFSDFTEGSYYHLSDIAKFYTFQSISDVALCTGKDNNTIKFLIIKSIAKAPITPGIPVKVVTNKAYFGWDSEDFDVKDFLRTSKNNDTFVHSELHGYDERYFQDGFKIILMEKDTGAESDNEIISAYWEDYLNIGGIADGEYWMYWRHYPDVIAKQQLWFFYQHGEY